MNEIIDNESVATPQMTGVEKLPNSGGILTLGILAIVLFGLAGLTLGIIGTAMSKKAIDLYNSNPSKYTEESYNQTKNGRVCSIIGICLSGTIILIVSIVVIANS